MKNHINYGEIVSTLQIHQTLKDTLGALIKYAMIQGKVYPSQKTLAKKIDKSERTVRNAVKRLEEMGFITRIQRSHLKTHIYAVNFDVITTSSYKFMDGNIAPCIKKISPDVAGEIAANKKINNILILANAKLEILKKEKGLNGAGQGANQNATIKNQNIIDLTQDITSDVMEKIVAEVNEKTNKSFCANYFLKSIEKIKQMDMTRGKSVIMTISLLIKRLIGWAKRELMGYKDVEKQTLEVIQKPTIESATIREMVEEICLTAKGNHPQKQKIMGVLKQTFDRFDKTLSFASWFKNMSLEEGQGGAAQLNWPTTFDRDWVNNNFGSELRYAFKQLGIAYELVA